MFIAFACFRRLEVYQMDVDSEFLNGDLEEEVYTKQTKGFQMSKDADQVCKLKKSLYGLNSAPKAWYSRLDRYL